MKFRVRPRKGIKLSTITSCVILIAVLLSIFITALTGYNEERNSLIRTTAEMNRDKADQMGVSLGALATSMKESIQKTAEMLADFPLEGEVAQQQMDDFVNVNYFNAALIVDTTGNIVNASPKQLRVLSGRQVFETSHLNDNSKQIYDFTKQNNVLRIVDLESGTLAGYVNSQIYSSKGEYRGDVLGLLYLSSNNIFSKVLGKQSKSSNGTYFYVVDQTGKIIFSPDAADLKASQDAVFDSTSIHEIMQDQDGDSIVTWNGEKYVAGYAPVVELGWGIVSQTPIRSINETSLRLFRNVLFISMPYIVTLLILSIWLSSKLAGPINRLARYASKLSDQDNEIEDLPEQRDWNYETNELAKAITNAFRRVKQDHDALSHQANTDPLTGVSNRRVMEECIQQWDEGHTPYAIVMMDLDHFKQINDTYGHQTGDEVLKFLTDAIQSAKREKDVCCRYGGEEFALLLPNTTAAQAYGVAERIRKIMEIKISPTGYHVTLSLGVSATDAMDHSVRPVIEAADEALYLAKYQGRNRTIVYEEMGLS